MAPPAAQPAEQQFGLSEAEKRHYEEHGYVIKRGVFPAAECRALTEHMTRVHDAGAPGYPRVTIEAWTTGTAGGSATCTTARSSAGCSTRGCGRR